MNDKPFKTDFSKAWKEYQQSEQYKNSIEILSRKNIFMPYSNNILFNSFCAGFNSKFKIPEHEQILN